MISIPTTTRAVIALYIVLFSQQAGAQVESIVVGGAAKIASSAASGAVIDEALKRVQLIIDDATQKGNYLLVRAAIEARIAIENFKMANSELLDKAFSALDETSRDNFARINSTLQEAASGTMAATQAALQITDNAQQLTATLDLQGFRSYLLRYSPSVAFEGKPSPIAVAVRGVNMDEAEAVLETSKGPLQPKIRGKQDLLFEVPVSELSFQNNKSSLKSFQLQYQSVKPGLLNRALGKKEQVNRDIVLFLLPKQLATFSLTTVVGGTKRSLDGKNYTLDQFRGVDADQEKAIAAPAGWKIDLASLGYSQGEGGGNSYCIGYSTENRTEFGVVFRAHVGRIKTIQNPTGSPGYVNCSVMYTLYKDDPTESAGPSATGSMSWTSDQTIQLPPNLKSFTLEVNTFEGIQRIHTNDDSTPIYTVTKEPSRILLRPKIPQDLLN